jgi:hypothetical protein
MAFQPLGVLRKEAAPERLQSDNAFPVIWVSQVVCDCITSVWPVLRRTLL